MEEVGEPVRFDDNYLKPSGRQASGSRKITIAVLSVIGLAILGWVVYYFYHQSVNADGPGLVLSEPPAQQADTTTATNAVTSIPADSSAAGNVHVNDTTPALTARPATSDSFNVVLEISRKQRAMKRYADLIEWGHKAVMVTSDSVEFKIFLPIKAPLSDTAKHRDSLSRFFARKVWIEKL